MHHLTAFSTATQMRDAVAGESVSAAELLEAHLRRIERVDGPLNSVVVRQFEDARQAARAADAARARGEAGALLGVPITVKESIDVAGTPSTAGVEARKSHRADRDARSVALLRAAGAVVLGKTNVCPWLADYIADNPVYGRTVSPWDARVTPGGSSGGSASVAAGLSALDLGSDLGGSIRLPAAFCGLWGHKPSEGAVPYSGHFPGSPLPNMAWCMTSQGPIARSAFDLQLALDVLAGADVGFETAWHLRLPPPRYQRLADFRVAVLPWQEWLPVDEEIVSAVEELAGKLRRAGATVETLSPPGLGSLRDYHELCRLMMSALVSSRWPDAHRERMIAESAARADVSFHADARGFAASAGDYLQFHERREAYRDAYRSFFADWDILLTPMTLVPAFAHPSLPVADRMLQIGSRSIPFDYLSFYPGVGSLCGQPCTAFPAGLSRSGLPLGAQAIGPFLEDRTPIRFAQLVEMEWGGLQRPPGWDSTLG